MNRYVERYVVPKTSTSSGILNRDELEDKFFRLKEAHQELKKEAHHADDQMKHLNSKLSRLLEEKKRLLKKDKTRREVDLEEIVYDLQEKIAHVSNENMRLREKILVLRTNMDTAIIKKKTTSSLSYEHVQSRVDSGLSHMRQSFMTRASSALVLNRPLIRPNTPGIVAPTIRDRPRSEIGSKHALRRTPSMPSFAFNLLHEAQDEIKRLEEVVAMQQSHILAMHCETEQAGMTDRSLGQGRKSVYHAHSHSHSNQTIAISNNNTSPSATTRTTIEVHGHSQNFNHDDDDDDQLNNKYQPTNAKSHSHSSSTQKQHQHTNSHTSSTSSNFDPFKRKQDSNTTTTQLLNNNNHNQFSGRKISGISGDIGGLIDKLENELESERVKCVELQKKLLGDKVAQKGFDELNQQVEALEKENIILRESLEKCVGSCLTEITGNINALEITQQSITDQRNQRHQEQMSQLENQIMHFQNQLRVERSRYEELMKEHEDLNGKYRSAIDRIKEMDESERRNKSELKLVSTVNNNRGDPECNRRDHLQLKERLESMQSERHQLLKEFDEMKRMLLTVQNSIRDEQDEEEGDNYEVDFDEDDDSSTNANTSAP